jgi:N-acetylglutamate synthase-like GNAT family acetyltransferase
MVGGAMFQEYRREDYLISTDPSRLQIDVIHDFLANRSYWAQDRTREQSERVIKQSVCFGLYHNNQLVGFARVVTDYVVIAYLADVFVLEDYRGRGLGKWLVSCVMAHPDLQDLKAWYLNTQDAHSLYSQFGWIPIDTPGKMMVYRK